jgi:pyruvate decarboxylase
MTDQISLGTYFFERMKESGVHSIFGVPGDFNLALLDHVKEVENIRWVGNANELNAGYETDGYSRINGFGCLVTTFGVGELSAVNAVAGSYAEHIPLIHVVGMPSISSTKKKLLLHHTLGELRFDDFTKMSNIISRKLKVIEDLENGPKIIDDLIETAILTKRPVYLGFPSNFSDALVPRSLLNKKLNLSFPPNDKIAETEFIENVISLIGKSSKPIILVDACVGRHGAAGEVAELAKLLNFPVFTTPMGKSSFNEDSDEFFGLYLGVLSAQDVRDVVETSDCVLSFGGLLSDYNTGSFTYSYSTTNVVEFHSNYCKFKKAVFDELSMKFAVRGLIDALKAKNLTFTRTLSPPPSKFDYQSAKVAPAGKLTHDYLWKRLSYFLKANDIVVAETGTSSFGILGTHIPKDVKSISQTLWGSIGYSLPAAVGATFAADDAQKFVNPSIEKRVSLFIGDGSLQLTLQAISDACRWNLKPYLFVLNNKGYTIEKLIHGPYESYNDIQPWRHQLILDLFADNIEYENLTVKTCEDLDNLMNNEKFNKPDKIRLIELFLDEFDAPEVLVQQGKLADKMNSS